MSKVKDWDKVNVMMNEHGMLVMEQLCEVRSGSTLDVITVNKERLPAFLQELGRLVHEQTVNLPKPKRASPRKRGTASSRRAASLKQLRAEIRRLTPQLVPSPAPQLTLPEFDPADS